MLNRCEFIGNCGADPEVKTLASGEKVANLRLAVSKRWKDKNGDQQEKTTWIAVVIWGQTADTAERFLRKGSKVYVAGAMENREWTDKDGNKRTSTEIVLNRFDGTLELLDKRDTTTAPEQAPRAAAPAPRPSGGGMGASLDDEIPFSPCWQ